MLNKPSKNVVSIANSDQCSHCGVCLGVCPRINNKSNLVISEDLSAKSDNWKLSVKNEDRCFGCGLCSSACPMDSIDYKALEDDVFLDRANLYDNPLLGVYKNCYVGYSLDQEMRLNGASGGIISTIVDWLVRNKKIDGAVEVMPSNSELSNYTSTVVTTKDQIIAAAKSHYLPIPAMQSLHQVIYGTYEKVAVVGLPCQISGLRLAQKRIAALQKKVTLTLGCFCGYTSHPRVERFLSSRLPKDRRENVQRFAYRTGKWPGKITVKYQNGESEQISGELRDHVAFPGILPACLFCADLFNEFADISFGDAWLNEYLERKDGGYSIVVVRSERGQKIIDEMVFQGLLYLEKIDASKVLESQQAVVIFKKQGLGARIALNKLFTSAVPDIRNARLKRWGIIDLVAAVLMFVQIRLSKRKWYWALLCSLNSKTVRLINKPNYFIQKRYDFCGRLKRKLCQKLLFLLKK